MDIDDKSQDSADSDFNEVSVPVSNITSRRRPTRLRRSGDQDDPTFSSGGDEQRRRRDAHEERQSRQAVVMDRARKLNEARDQPSTKNEGQSGIVQNLIAAQLKSKIALGNCFEQRTVLDVIDKSFVENESIMDMAVAIDSASVVYGYRVDKTHIDAQDACVTFTKGKEDGDNSAAAPTPDDDDDSDRDRRRKRKGPAIADDDWKNRCHGLIDGEEQRIEHTDDWLNEKDADDDDEEEEEEPDQKQARLEEAAESLNSRVDLDVRLVDIKNYRKLKSKISKRNTMLEEDEDRICMVGTQLSENDYYQKAVSKHSEGTAVSLLLYNARSSGDGRVLYMHSHIDKDDLSASNALPSLVYMNSFRATLSNALAVNPIKLENDLLPPVESQQHFIRSGVLDHSMHQESDEEVEAMDTESDVPGPSNTEDNVMEDANEDMTMLPDRTILEKTMMPNMTILPQSSDAIISPLKKTRRANHMKGRDIKEMYIDDQLDLACTSFDPSGFKRMAKVRSDVGSFPRRNILNSEELNPPIEELWDETKYCEFAGLDDDFRDIDALWNADVVEKTVTEEDTLEDLKAAEEQGLTDDEVRARKKRVLPPGHYVFFMESKLNKGNIPADPWSEEGASASVDYEEAADVEGHNLAPMDTSFDAELMSADGDFDGGAEDFDVPMDDPLSSPTRVEPTEEDDQMVRTIMGLDRESPIPSDTSSITAAPNDDVPDVPMPDAIVVDPDVALKTLGKIDDSHWKVNQVPEKKERQKKDRTVKEEIRVDEQYFVISNEAERSEAMSRFRIVKPAALDRSEEVLFMRKKVTDRRPHLAYKFEDFCKPGLLFQGSYGGIRFERSMAVQPEETQFHQMLNTLDSEEDVDDVCRQWLINFGSFKIYKQNEDDPDETFASRKAGVDDQGGYDDDMACGAAFDDDGYEAPGIHINHNDQDAVEARVRREKVQEALRDMNDTVDSDDDDGEVVMMLDKKIFIRNTNIDQSKVKSCFKEILTNSSLTINKMRNVAVQSLTNEEEKEVLLKDLRDYSDEEVSEPHHCVDSLMAPAHDYSQSDVVSRQTENSEDGPQMSSGVILPDFKIEGKHTMTSVYSALPYRTTRPQEKTMHVAYAFSIALQMCNENNLQLYQNIPEDSEMTGRTEDWMGDFIIRNAPPAGGKP